MRIAVVIVSITCLIRTIRVRIGYHLCAILKIKMYLWKKRGLGRIHVIVRLTFGSVVIMIHRKICPYGLVVLRRVRVIISTAMGSMVNRRASIPRPIRGIAVPRGPAATRMPIQ